MNQSYVLGAAHEEQCRLDKQLALYGDTAGIQFDLYDQVYEFGCGPGVNLWIASQVSKGTYVGIDIEPLQIEKARQQADVRKLTNVEFLLADSLTANIPPSVSDAVFARCYLVHQEDPSVHLRTMREVLKPGGRIMLIEPQDSSLYATPDKEHLMKAWRAKMAYTEAQKRGSPNVALELHPLLVNAEFENVLVKPHVITCTGANPSQCLELLANWIGMIDRVSEVLIKESYLSEQELNKAREESRIVTPATFATLTMWVAEGVKCPLDDVLFVDNH